MADTLSSLLPALPSAFVWGASTSAYQIEGAVTEDGRGPSIWDTRCRQAGGIGDGSNADIAADHYHRWREDIGLMRELGIGAYRFSVAWPRLLPRGRGKVNPAGVAFYDRLIDGLLEAGIEPWLCLYHWDLPQALDDLGGWTNRECVGWYEDYAVLVARRYGDRVKHFATFNEFSVFTLFGYAIPWAAPGVSDRAAHLRAIHHVNLAHGAGVDILRSHVKEASIGGIHNRQAVRPASDSQADQDAAALLDAHWNGVFCDPQCLGAYPDLVAETIEPFVKPGDLARICRPLDWLGLNHYGPIFARADATTPWGYGWADTPPAPIDPAIGWAIFPEAFTEELLTLHHRYHLPIYVTENGCGGGAGSDQPDADGQVADSHRIAYLRTYLAALNNALTQGADVRGYFVWSLLDAFEWGSGYGPRFGLIHVDFASGTRTLKHSGQWYRSLIQNS